MGSDDWVLTDNHRDHDEDLVADVNKYLTDVTLCIILERACYFVWLNVYGRHLQDDRYHGPLSGQSYMVLCGVGGLIQE